MTEAKEDQKKLVKEVIAHLQALPLDGVPEEWFTAFHASEGHPEVEVAVSISPEIVAPVSSEAVPACTEMGDLSLLAAQCRKCRLAETRKNVVFGTGNAESPQIVFVGEGPGADEDASGEPFVGKAGALLTAAITKGLGLRREDVYICNVVKCRPPQNRNPLPDEVASCVPFLFRQLELLKPRVIVTLGSPAQQALCGNKLGITKLRGNWLEWRGIKVMPTFHPAYILRSPSAKRPFWEDLQEVMREVGLRSA